MPEQWIRLPRSGDLPCFIKAGVVVAITPYGGSVDDGRSVVWWADGGRAVTNLTTEEVYALLVEEDGGTEPCPAT